MDFSLHFLNDILDEYTLIIVLVFVVTALYLFRWTGQGSIPGPRPWPILGSYPLMARTGKGNLKLFCKHLHEKYGPVARFYFGGYPVVLISGYPLCQEVFVNRRDVIVCRPDFVPGVKITRHLGPGVVMANGLVWTEGRKTMMAAVNAVLGSSEYEELVLLQEVHQLLQEFKDKGGVVQPREHLLKASVSWMFGGVAGKRYGRYDVTYQRFLEAFLTNSNNDGSFSPAGTIPLFRYIPLLNKSFNKMLAALANCEDIFRSLIRERKSCKKDKSFAAVDVFITEQEKNPENTTFTDDNIISSLTDYIKGGTTPSANTITWGLSFLATHPDVQARCQIEIDEVCGKTDPVTFSHMDKLPYTCATVYETQRLKSIVPTSIPYTAVTDVTIEGYHIPRGTMIVEHLASIHMDETQWTEPKQFKPERFLNGDGKLIKKPPAFVPFGNSFRKCPGGPLSEKDIIIVFANLVQAFEFSSVTKSDSDVTENEDPTAVTLRVKPRT